MPLPRPKLRQMRALAVIVAIGAAALATASSAGAYYIEGRGWPGGQITYYAGVYPRAVDRAAAIWNNAGVGITFRRATRDTARVVIGYGPRGCGGRAIVGYPGGGQSWVKLNSGCNRNLMVLTTVHEFGHVIGLGHQNSRCARMNPTIYQDGTPNLCAHHPLSWWLTHALKADDVAGARAIYGAR